VLTFLQGAALVGATITVGLMAGVFGLYAHAIMPGLGRTDDRTFVGAFQSIDRAIINPLFIPTFLGALILTGTAAALFVGDDEGSVWPWVALALVLYLAAFVITRSRRPGIRIALLTLPPCASASRIGGCAGTSSARWYVRLRSPASSGPSWSTGGPLSERDPLARVYGEGNEWCSCATTQ
jgi:uncharacterized membrane protein